MEWSIWAIWTRIGGADDRRRGICWWREVKVACCQLLMGSVFDDFLVVMMFTRCVCLLRSEKGVRARRNLVFCTE